MTYKFAMQSDEFGREWFTGYETKEEAQEAQDRIKRKQTRSNDGVLRFYSDVYPEDAQFDEKVEDEDEFYGLREEEDGFYFTPEGDQS